MRINKYLSDSGYCSRRKADELVKAGQVFVNGVKAELGSKVFDGDKVKVGNEMIVNSDSSIYIAYHKPIGVICTTDENSPDNIISKIKIKERVYPVGRLDVESSGLIFLTNDGDWANKVSHPKYEHDKEYEVELDSEISDMEIQKLRKGIKLEEGIAKADRVKKFETKIFITLHQGWNRQVRRMLEAVGHQVKSLKRIRIGEVKLRNLKVAEYRSLTDKEIQSFK